MRSKAPTNETDEKLPTITPLKDFSWETTEPPQFRPFRGKDKFNLTMGNMIFSIMNIEPG
jgi:hypothetical protein